MTASLKPVLAEADILPAYRNTAVGALLRLNNLAIQPEPAAQPGLVLGACTELAGRLALPRGFAVELHTAAASLKRVPFDVSWGLGGAGAGAIALVGHGDCGFVGLRAHRDSFVERLITVGGWERPAAEQHFDHWSDLFEVTDPGDFLLEESRRLAHRYPRLLVAPLLLDPAGKLQQVID